MNIKMTKIIIGLLAPSLVAGMGIVTVNNIKSNSELGYAEGFRNADVVKVEKEVKEAKKDFEEAEKQVEKAEKVKDAAEKKVKSANETIAKAIEAKKIAEKELASATTAEAKEAARAKLKAAEDSISKAKETKKEAQKEVNEATKAVKKAEEVKKEAEAKVEKTVEKAEEVKKAEQSKQPETKKESNRQFTDEQLKYMLEQAKKGEERQKKEYEEKVKAIEEEAAAKKAEREAREAAERAAAEKEAQERAARESTESLKSRGYVKQDTQLSSPELSSAQRQVDVAFDPNSKENPRQIICTGGYCGDPATGLKGDPGYIWFAKFESNCPVFVEPGTGRLVNSVLIGRRSSVYSWIQYVPTYACGKTLDLNTWNNNIRNEIISYNIAVNVYSAIYN